MSQFKHQSDMTRGVMDGDAPPNLKEEQEDEVYMPNMCDASFHSEENSPSQVNLVHTKGQINLQKDIWISTFH